jgi:hypothetical protein
MGHGTALFNGFFTTSNTFKQTHASLQRFICGDVDEICARHTMLRDQDRLAIALQLGQQFRCLALQSGNKLGTHKSDTKVSLWQIQAIEGETERIHPVVEQVKAYIE